MEYKDLVKLPVPKLREMAMGHDDIIGASGMGKDELVELLSIKLNIRIPQKKVVGIDKKAIKTEIASLKVKVAAAIEAKDKDQTARLRRKIKLLKRELRRAAVAVA